MRPVLVAATLLSVGCAPATFHEGRTSLALGERPYLAPRSGAASGVFQRFWQAPGSRPWGLLRWDESRSSAATDAPGDLLQAIRDEIGRLNQGPRYGEVLVLAVTVYRFARASLWNAPAAHCELVARDVRGQVIWAADDTIEAKEALAQSLVDPPGSIIAREILRKLRRKFSL